MAIYFFFITVNIPYIGLETSFDKDKGWEVSHVSNKGLADRWGITAGDKILSINDRLPHEHQTVQRYSLVEQINTLTVEKDGEIFAFEAQLYWGDSQFFWQSFFPGLFFILCSILALFIVSKKRTKATWILVLFILILGLSLLSGMASARADLLARVTTGLVILSTPVLFLHFIRLFFHTFDIRLFPKGKLLFFYVLNSTIFLVQLMFIFGESGQVYFYSSYLLLSTFIIMLGYGLCILLWHFVLYRNTVYAPLFKVLILGIILSFAPFIMLHGLPYILTGKELVSSTITSLFFLFLPVTLFHLFVSNSLLDVDFILSRLNYHALLGLFPTIFILLLVDFITITPLGSRNSLLLFLIVYLLIILLFYAKEYMDYKFRYFLFPKKNSVHSNLSRLVQRFSQVMKRTELEQTLAHELKQILSVESLFFFRVHKTEDSLEIIDYPLEEENILLAESLRKSRNRLIVGELLFLPEGLCLVVAEPEEEIVLLWIGNKRDRTYWNVDERMLLNTLAHYISLVYENLLLVEKLSGQLEQVLHKEETSTPWMKRLLFSIAEKERRHLARDLHDTVLQDQIVILRKIEELSTNLSSSASIQEELLWLKDMVLNNIEQLRETCNLLLPPLLQELGLVGALEKMLDLQRLRVDFDIDFDFTQFIDNLGGEHKLTLYRIIQELLTNASKHAQASKVYLKLATEDERVTLQYRDNGIGLDSAPTHVASGHLGLWGIRERAYSLQGDIQINSAEGKGLSIYISLPFESSRQE